MITVCTLLWDANRHSKSFSSMYDEHWVERLWRGVARNLTQPFRFVLYTDRGRAFEVPLSVRRLDSAEPRYGDCIQPYEMNEPMILVGLDTIICGNIDHLASYCLTEDVIALPRDPYAPHRACNGVALVPAGNAHVWELWRGENDMEWMRRQEHRFIDDIFPGHVQSFKGSVKAEGLGDTRICYFHGKQKPHELPRDHPIREHWV